MTLGVPLNKAYFPTSYKQKQHGAHADKRNDSDPSGNYCKILK
jgi:hypothetical protein